MAPIVKFDRNFRMPIISIKFCNVLLTRHKTALLIKEKWPNKIVIIDNNNRKSVFRSTTITIPVVGTLDYTVVIRAI